MSLSHTLITLLQDEAYLDLSRASVSDALNQIAAQKNAAESMRPPFGILASKRSRTAFAASMDNLHANEAAVRCRLAKIDVLETGIKGPLQSELQSYLETAAPEHCLGRRVLAELDSWESILVEYAETLKGFARELRETTNIIRAPHFPFSQNFEQRTNALAQLHLAAERVDRLARRLDLAAQKIVNLAGTQFAGLRLPPPPFVQQAEWVGRSAGLPNPELAATLSQREPAVRAVLANNLSGLRLRVNETRAQIRDIDQRYLETYWSQLRAHAQQHYVNECDVDEVLAALEERYVTANIRRRKHTLSDPYGVER